ncbi:MAG: hypothetical protein KC917_03045 [Candidatus Omnitrophica bacterium]|nr:hypothetical protein [Candidatus Omnitrophota bacterium]MCB9768870.1 hypothetical protein [Candidatus Omnitrophota bacterium]
MRKANNSFFARLALPLMGLLVTSHLLLAEDRTEANASKNDAVDRLRLNETDGVEVIEETVYTKEQLFDHHFFRSCFENKQVWASFQMLRAGEQTVCLYFVDFRNREDADWAMQRLLRYPSQTSVRKCQAFGTVVAYVQAPQMTPVGVLDGILQSVQAETD